MMLPAVLFRFRRARASQHVAQRVVPLVTLILKQRRVLDR